MVALLVAAKSFAYVGEVKMQIATDNDKKGKDHRDVAPTVKFDERFIYVESQTLIPKAIVTVKDGANKVLYRQALPLSPATNIIDLPDNDKRVITITYDKTAYYGVFDEE